VVTNYQINGWEKLESVYDFNGVIVDVILAEKSNTKLINPTTFTPVELYTSKFTVYHSSKGKSNIIELKLSIDTVDGTNCELCITDDTTIVYRNWASFQKWAMIMKTPQLFLKWVIYTINAGHRYFSPSL
jgi:hypothetical protein